MHWEEIRKRVKKSPFEPFRIHMSDGSSYYIPHPDFVHVTRRDVLVGLGAESDEVPERSIFLDPLHITRIEPGPNGRNANKPPTRKRKR